MSSRQQGLTLIELMVTLAVAIILLAVGMPLFSGVAANNRAVAQTNALVTALNVARSEAVRRGTSVALCTNATPLPVASPACATSSPVWTNGWFVFVDSDADGAVDAGEPVLRIWESLSAGAAVTKGTTSAPVWVTFETDGTTNTNQRHTFQLSLAGASASQPRCVTVTPGGNIRLARGNCPP